MAVYRFGAFEFDSETGEVQRTGHLARLRPQPARILEYLLQRPGQLVSRAELQRAIWPEGTFVHFDDGLNSCLKQIRAALGGRRPAAAYVETLVRRGLRVIAPVVRHERSRVSTMASVTQEIITSARPEHVWDAIRDIGALHTRLVVGFVLDTRLEPGARIVTFKNGVVVREPIVTVDEQARRLVWSSDVPKLTHYNASVQVFEVDGQRSRVVWIADFLPDDAQAWVAGMIGEGMAAMKATLDAQSA